MIQAVDNLIFKIAARLGIKDPNAFIHILVGSLWGAGWANLFRVSRWTSLSIPAFILLVLYREFIDDGHLKRLVSKTETPGELHDLKEDLSTKLVGLLFYLLAFAR